MEDAIMRTDRKHLFLGVTLAGAIAGAMSVQLSSFVDGHTWIGQAVAIAYKVAGVTNVDATNINK